MQIVHTKEGIPWHTPGRYSFAERADSTASRNHYGLRYPKQQDPDPLTPLLVHNTDATRWCLMTFHRTLVFEKGVVVIGKRKVVEARDHNLNRASGGAQGTKALLDAPRFALTAEED